MPTDGAAASNFTFLRPTWPSLFEAAQRAETLAFPDPRAACFYARRALELAVAWLYVHDRALRLPYQDHLAALLHEPTFQHAVGPALFAKADVIKHLGNQAVHSPRPVRAEDARTTVRELFHFTYWLARTYAPSHAPVGDRDFDPALLPQTSPIPPQALSRLQALDAELKDKDLRLSQLLRDHEALDAELRQLREEVARAKAQNAARPDDHDYNEAETRDFFIDLLLKEAGWPLDHPDDREFPVIGMPNQTGQGFVDYVLWGDDGKPLGLVEAKRTRKDARAGQRQAELYADCLERRFGQRPVIFYSNGYEHWLWDDRAYPPRPVQGFYQRDELALLIGRRNSRKSLADTPIDPAIVERYYQIRAVRRIGEAFERDRQRRALCVMATGAGKTRTVIALCDLLLRAGWAKRILFLADRLALVKQAVGAFKRHLPSAAPVNLVTDRDDEGRVYVCTYPTMLGLIDRTRTRGDGDRRRFGPGHFDLIIIDEAHRSVYQKYRALFDYFDGLLVGLTATPREEIDRNTYGLFGLETRVPTDVYELTDAIRDGYLVPPRAVSVPLRFQREGLHYKDLPEEDQERWDAIDWSDEDDEVPAHVEPAAVNRWFFNEDTVDKVLAHLMVHGQKVAGGDRLGKTIIFAKNHDHALFIEQRFNANYPAYRGSFARVIDNKIAYAQSLIDDFSHSERTPHIAISVDMLDTGIDVPEVVNLVFFKLVRSPTKFRQMLGRGTRLCRELFGPGGDKQFFLLFDFCENLEFFRAAPEAAEGAAALPLSARLFNARLELIGALDERLASHETTTATTATTATASTLAAKDRTPGYGRNVAQEADLRGETAELLRARVAAMNLGNFIVRPRRRAVEKYREATAWRVLKDDDRRELSRELAALPSELPDDDEEAKRFDLLLLRLQLSLLHGEPGFPRLRDQVQEIAGLLADQQNIPMIRAELALILDLQSDEYWQDVTVPMLETARKRLRALVRLIERRKRRPVYTDFEDELGAAQVIELPGMGGGADFEQFRQKARQFLRAHEQHVAIQKLRLNRPLTAVDLDELDRMLAEAGLGTGEDLERARRESEGLGLFVRSLVGLDRGAAKAAFDQFLMDRTATADQIHFIGMIVDYLTEYGVMDAGRLYESPFTDAGSPGPERLFPGDKLDAIIAVLDEVRRSAAA